MAHQPKDDNFVITGLMWLTSLIAAISSHHTFKSTNFYKHFNLQRFDHELLVPVAIIILHAVLAFMTRVKYLIEMRGPNEPPLFVRIMETQLQLQGMIVVVLNEKLLNDEAMITTTTTFSIFLMCFFRSVAPGFGWKLPAIPITVAWIVAHRVSRLLEFVPIFILISLVAILFSGHNDRQVGRQKEMHSQTGS